MPKGFASFQPHGNDHDFARYPQIWVAYQIMMQLAGRHLRLLLAAHRAVVLSRIQGTQGSAAASRTSSSTRCRRVCTTSTSSASARPGALPTSLFAVSLMMLTLTGMPLFYSDVAWAPAIMKAAGWAAHRGHHPPGGCAVIFAGVFFWHLVYMLIRDRPQLEDLQALRTQLAGAEPAGRLQGHARHVQVVLRQGRRVRSLTAGPTGRSSTTGHPSGASPSSASAA